MSTLILSFATALLILAPFHGVTAQQRYVVTPESRLWIAGSSNVNSFTCEADEAVGFGELSAVSDEVTIRTVSTTAEILEPRVEVIIPVQRLDCGRERMNSDLKNALKADEHPTIRFSLEEAEVLGEVEDRPEWYRLRAVGELTIAGTTRRIEVKVEGRQSDDGSMYARGSKKLRMSDFNVEPPSAVMGLVRARDLIEVHFDLVGRVDGVALGHK